MKSIFQKSIFPKAPGGDRYEWKKTEVKFKIPKSGRYIIAITASAQNGEQNKTGDDDDLRVTINGYEFGKTEIHSEKTSYHGFGTSAAWDGASLKGGTKTVYFFINLDAEIEKLFWFDKKQEQIIKFFADGKPKIKSLKVYEITGDYYEIPSEDIIPIKTDRKGIPWRSMIFLGMRPKNIHIYANCKSAEQKHSTDDDNVKIVINGKILQNLEAPTADRYKNFYFSGNLDKGITKKLDIETSCLTGFENSIEIWYDETPLFGAIEISLFSEDNLERYLLFNDSLAPFPIPLKDYFLEIRDYILSAEFEQIKNKSNVAAVDALWQKALEIEGYDFTKTSNLLVYGVYFGGGDIPFETETERNKRIEALPRSIFDGDKNDNRDKLQHFFGSTNFILRFGKNLTEIAGKTKERVDKWFGKTGYDPKDIDANIRGIEFGFNLKTTASKNLKPSNFLKP